MALALSLRLLRCRCIHTSTEQYLLQIITFLWYGIYIKLARVTDNLYWWGVQVQPIYGQLEGIIA